MTDDERKAECERTARFYNALSQWAPRCLIPTAAELQRVSDAAWWVAKAIRRYDRTLGGKPAAELRSPEAMRAFLMMLRYVDELLTVGMDVSDGGGFGDTEVKGWRSFDEAGNDLHTFEAVVVSLARLDDLLQDLQSCLDRVAPQVVDADGCRSRSYVYRWWLYDAAPMKPKELVASWHSPDDAEQLARELERRGLLSWTMPWDLAQMEFDKHPSPDTQRLRDLVHRIGNGLRSTPPAVSDVDIWELWLRVGARCTSEVPPQDLLFGDDLYENKDIVLDTATHAWPRLGDQDDLAEEGLSHEFARTSQWLQGAIDEVTTRVVRDPWGMRRLRIPPGEFPFSVHPLPYPDDYYERDPFRVAQDIEALTRVRLRDGGNPLLLLSVFQDYTGLPPSAWNGNASGLRKVVDEATARNASGVSFGEYFHRRYPQECSPMLTAVPPESRAQKEPSTTTEGEESKAAEVPIPASAPSTQDRAPGTRPGKTPGTSKKLGVPRDPVLLDFIRRLRQKGPQETVADIAREFAEKTESAGKKSISYEKDAWRYRHLWDHDTPRNEPGT